MYCTLPLNSKTLHIWLNDLLIIILKNLLGNKLYQVFGGGVFTTEQVTGGTPETLGVRAGICCTVDYMINITAQ